MKQLAQYQDGRLELQEVPTPVPPPGGVLVQTTHSVISVGTEKMKVSQARMNLLQKARARPDQVRKVLDTARTLGWKSALEKVRNRLESPAPLGYSAAGIVAAVDPLNTRFRAGDRVACAGAECAHHAEFLAMPDLLCAAIPDGVESWQAAYTTVASIALQAVRQSEITLGSRAAVIGQGLIGILITNLLENAGVRVIATDLLSARKEACLSVGAEIFCDAGREDLDGIAMDWSEGYGVDCVFLCTATSQNKPVEQATSIVRDRGRLVVVGNTRTDLDWKRFYEKEIDVRYSRSYGPGRYDPSYEWGGSDYPIGYVRWTEGRNMEACLALMRDRKLHLEAITTRRVRFDSSPEVYRDLVTDGGNDLGIVLEYGESGAGNIHITAEAAAQPSPGSEAAQGGHPSQLSAPVARLHTLGAGNFARTMLLPHLVNRIPLGTVANQTALSAHHASQKFGFEKASSDGAAVLSQARNEAVLIATRHHLHGAQVCAALAGNNHVFVEKPLCLTESELREIDGALEQSKGSVMVGFNRRFSPAARLLKDTMNGIAGPKSISIVVNSGPLDPGHWYANYAESGGRVVGEACHFFDALCFLAGSAPHRVHATPVGPVGGRLAFPDTVAAQVEFENGTVGQVIYSAEGDPSFPKETVHVLGNGLAATITNFLTVTIHRRRKSKRYRFRSKGHADEMAAWLAFLQGSSPHPLPYSESRASMALTFSAIRSIQENRPIYLDLT